MKKNIWIIGCSSGIGLQLVKLYLQEGYNVIASARSASKSYELEELNKIYKSSLKIVDIDVSNTQIVENSTQQAFEYYDTIDMVLFNAGVYEVMNSDNWDIKHFENMTNINYLGAIRVINALLPYFDKQGFGRCVFNASLSSYFGLPYGGAYSATKSALVNFAQSIQPELLTKNVQIQIINHGFVNTRLTQKNDFDMPELMDAKTAALNIFKGLENEYRFEIRFPFKLSLFLKLLNILPYKFSLAITKRLLK